VNKNKPTTTRVAELAGISHMTVSRVLNNSPYVKKETRQKVLAACRKLNYRPNLIATALRSKKSGAIGVIVPTFQHTFYARLLNSIEKKCRKTGYHIITIQGQHKDQQTFITQNELEFLLARQVDGLLIDLRLDDDILKRLKKESIPTVFVDVPPKDNGFSFVGTADLDGGKNLTRYLLHLGHRQIAFLAGPKDAYTSERRLAGYRTALIEARINFDKNLVFYTNYTTGGGYEAAKRLLANSAPITAIIGANDYIAIGALSALAENGIKVPQKISVAGFTGDEIGAFTVPPLTTMGQPIEEIGRKAIEILLALIKDPRRPTERILLPATLLKRSSTTSLI